MSGQTVSTVPAGYVMRGKHPVTDFEIFDFRAEFDSRITSPTEISTLDGVRMAFSNGDTVHFRQSGNAPEMRIYVETGNQAGTERLLSELIAKLALQF